MKHFIRVMILTAFTSACVADRLAIDEGVSHKLDSYYAGLCHETAGLRQCAQQIEKQAMEDHPGQAVRRDDVLIVNGKYKEPTIFRNRPDVKYAYAGSLFETDIVLEIIEEGWSALLIPSSEQATLRLPGLPLFSPDGQYFAVLSLDIDAGYKPNTVQIWQRRNGRFEKSYELADFPEDGGPLHIRWTSPDSLHVQVITPDQLYNGNTDNPITLTITKTSQGWKRSNARKY